VTGPLLDRGDIDAPSRLSAKSQFFIQGAFAES
jgi:hypothetical protein